LIGGKQYNRIKQRGEKVSINLTKEMQDLVLEGSVPAKAVAQEIGKPYPTLMREVNIYDNGAKLGVDTFVEILQATNCADPLRKLANEMGFDLVPLSSEAFQIGKSRSERWARSTGKKMQMVPLDEQQTSTRPHSGRSL
jgi:hypothetical protein